MACSRQSEIATRLIDVLTSNVDGDLMADPAFWAYLFEQVQNYNPAASKGAIANQIADLLYKLLSKLVAGLNQDSFNSAELVNDLGTIRTAF